MTLLALVVAVILGISVAACSSNTGSAARPDDSTSADNTPPPNADDALAGAPSASQVHVLTTKRLWYGPKANGKTVYVHATQRFAIYLTEAVDGGYVWKLTGDSAPKVALRAGSRTVAAKSGLDGAPATRVFYFRAAATGTSNIVLSQAQPWQGGDTNGGSYNLTVVVSA